MDKLDAMIEAHGWQNIEFVAWEWAMGLDAEKLAKAETALASDGVDGIGDLYSVGGLDGVDIAGLVALAEARLVPVVLAA